MRIAVIGASGFLGVCVTQRLISSGFDVVPVVRKSGGAVSTARLGLDMSFADVLRRDSIAKAIGRCSHVVNCTMGNREVMLKGLDNIISVCKEENIKRLVPTERFPSVRSQ